ncbi:hypothetical protein Scep_019574 [Stephania cephalantha]|uniref:Uncharacterized protein n=1 Tax=Stephania cephalantha TaxID=152367 RepID=A0AAP0IB56_9MAGN
MRGDCDSNSSGDEDGDAEWRAAIESVTSNSGAPLFGANGPSFSTRIWEEHNETKALKFYQIKAQKLLDEVLERRLVMVKNPIFTLDNCEQANEAEAWIRLFRLAPRGVMVNPIDENQEPRRRPKILPCKEIKEKSKKFYIFLTPMVSLFQFRDRVLSVAVDGTDIIAAATNSNQKALARSEAKVAALKAAAKIEEERVAELRKIRGEKWLPSITKEMQVPNLGYDDNGKAEQVPLVIVA